LSSAGERALEGELYEAFDPVIVAGSVVTKDVPADIVAAGNACRPLRRLEAVS